MDATKQTTDTSEDNAFLWQMVDDLGAVFRECLSCLYDHIGGLPGLYQLNPEQRRLLETAAIDVFWRCEDLASMVEQDIIRRALTEAVSVVLSWQGEPEKPLTAGEAQEAIDKIRAAGSLFDKLILRHTRSRREQTAGPGPREEWSRPMSKDDIATALGLSGGYKLTALAKQDIYKIKKAGNRQTWRICLSDLPEEVRKKLV